MQQNTLQVNMQLYAAKHTTAQIKGVTPTADQPATTTAHAHLTDQYSCLVPPPSSVAVLIQDDPFANT